MKDYYESKITHLKEQIEELKEQAERVSRIINNLKGDLQNLERYERTVMFIPNEYEDVQYNIECLKKNLEYYNCRARSIERSIAGLRDEIDSVRRQQKNQYKTKCSADEGYDDVSIMLIIERNGFIGGTRL